MSKVDDWLVFQLGDLMARAEPGTLSMEEFLRTPSIEWARFRILKMNHLNRVCAEVRGDDARERARARTAHVLPDAV
jgi:hypothetical protein